MRSTSAPADTEGVSWAWCQDEPVTKQGSPTGRVPPWGLASMSMLSVQLGSALAVGLIEVVGPAGTAWLRLSIGALIFLAIARPPLRTVSRGDLPTLLGLGQFQSSSRKPALCHVHATRVVGNQSSATSSSTALGRS